jgi:hypothetical protein
MKRLGVTLILALALVLAPYQLVARAENIANLPIAGMSEGECPKGAVIKVELADGRLLALGDNHRAIMAEPSNEGDGFPVITLGIWNEDTGELTLLPKTKHQAQPGDSLCRDLFPETT